MRGPPFRFVRWGGLCGYMYVTETGEKCRYERISYTL